MLYLENEGLVCVFGTGQPIKVDRMLHLQTDSMCVLVWSLEPQNNRGTVQRYTIILPTNHLCVFGVETTLPYIHANNVHVRSKRWWQINRYRPADIIRHLSFLSLSLSFCLNVLLTTDRWMGSTLQLYNEINMALSGKSRCTNTSINTSNKIRRIKEKGKIYKNQVHVLQTSNSYIVWL